MCGRFSQSQTRAEYLAYLAGEVDAGFSAVPEPIGRYNVAPGTRVLLLSESNDQLQLDPVLWGYSPPWWHKAPLINARAERGPLGKRKLSHAKTIFCTAVEKDERPAVH
ncbi:SOS response-associated peptidase family protein [Enterobacter hormaechei]